MNLLAIETASESCSVALSAAGEVCTRQAHAPREHAERLLPWVQSLLAEAGLRVHDLDAIAFSRGPGSFTSLRIGIGVVQGLAWGAQVPVVPVSSLQTMAQASVARGVGAALVALDARMDEVYGGLFRLDEHSIMRPDGPERVGSPAALAAMATAEVTGVGNGFARYAELAAVGQSLAGVHADIWPEASSLLTLAAAWLECNPPLPPEQAQAVYLRDRVADKPPGAAGS